jgi:hemolysin activation/secretion protein
MPARSSGGLEQQLPLPFRLALPKATTKEQEKASQAKAGDVRFTVNSFVLECIKLPPEADIQAALQPWLGKDIGFDNLQNACNAIQNYCRKKATPFK